MNILIKIESLTEGFSIQINNNEKQVKPKVFMLEKIGPDASYVIRIVNVNTGKSLIENFRLNQIQVHGNTYGTYEELSEVLTPMLFNKGGGSGSGGTGNYLPLAGTVNGSPLSGNVEIDNSDDRMFYSKYYGAYLMFGGDGTVEINQTNGSNVYINGLDISAKNSSGDGIQGAAYYGANYIDNSFVQKKYVDDKVGSVYKIKGSVANYASLPSAGQIEGDVWNLIDIGDNYVWVLDLNNTGIAGWDKLSSTTVVELNTLATVMNRGNYAPKPIYFVNGDEEYTSLGMNQTTYSMFWGNMNRNHTGDVNIAMGYDSMGGLTTGTASAGYAVGALNLLTTGSRNTGIGQGALNKVVVNSDNTAVGQASFLMFGGEIS